MISTREERLREKIKFHKEQTLKYEEALRFEGTTELLLVGDLSENGVLNVRMSSRSIGHRDRVRSSASKYKMSLSRKGREITCDIVSTFNTSLRGVGKAICCEDDKFDYDKGIRLAELRARADFYNCVAKYEESRM